MEKINELATEETLQGNSPEECSMDGCHTEVFRNEDYFGTPCGTFCDDHMAEHVQGCEICMNEFPEFADELSRFKCPTCGGDDVQVSITTWARMITNTRGEIETDTEDADDNSHDWDGKSMMKCLLCCHMAPADEFDTAKDEAAK